MHELALEFYIKAAENNHVEAINHQGLIMNNDIESKKLFEKALELNKSPKSTKDYKNKGDSLLGLKKHNEAVEFYNKAIQLNPNDPVLFNNKGASLSMMQKYQNAIDCFDEAIESNPNYAEAYFKFSLTYLFISNISIKNLNNIILNRHTIIKVLI